MWFIEIHFGRAGDGRFYVKCPRCYNAHPGPYAYNVPLPIGLIPTGNWLLKCMC
jgi:hypothetical protein